MTQEQARLAELRRHQAALKEKSEQLKVLADLALKLLDDRCPVCGQTYDKKGDTATPAGLPKRLEEYRQYYEPRKSFHSSRLFSCGAGSRTFHIDPYGKMTMCLLLREPAFNLREMSFGRIWNEMFPPVYNRMRTADHGCNSCNFVSLCGKCPAWSQMEKGDLEVRVEYSCEVGHRRAQKLGYYDGPLDQYSSLSERRNEILLPVI